MDSVRTFADYGLSKIHDDRAGDTGVGYEYQRDTFAVARVCERPRGMTLNLGVLIATCGLVDADNGAAVAARTAATLQLWSADNKSRTVNGWKSWRISSAVTADELTARVAPSKTADRNKLLAFLRSQHGDLLTAQDDYTSAWQKLVLRVNGKPTKHYTNGKKKGEADSLILLRFTSSAFFSRKVSSWYQSLK